MTVAFLVLTYLGRSKRRRDVKEYGPLYAPLAYLWLYSVLAFPLDNQALPELSKGEEPPHPKKYNTWDSLVITDLATTDRALKSSSF